MKYVVVHGSGMLDAAQKDLGGKMTLQAAATPHLDLLASKGIGGLTSVSAEGAAEQSDLVHFAVLGYDAQKQYPGPGPFQAAGLGVVLGEADVAYICSMVTLTSGGRDGLKKLAPHVVMEGPLTGGMETDQARELIDAVNEHLGSEDIQFYPGSGDRHVMVWVGGKVRASCIPPEQAAGKPLSESLPRGDGSELLRQLMEASLLILRDHPVNEERRGAGLKPANCLWLWGQGRWPRVLSLADRYQVTGSILAKTDLHKGVGICAGLEPVDSVEDMLHELEKKAFVYVHVSLPRELNGDTDPKAKVRFVETFDRDTLGMLLKRLDELGPHRILAVCDSAGFSTMLGGTASALYSLYEGPFSKQVSSARRFCDMYSATSPSRVRDAGKLLSQLFRNPSTP
jgi:2,3-bisphosphoglycerate-independent phosphoglycerate mutase